jgi:pimeloyl-ACP methyl ester carboxylesterase
VSTSGGDRSVSVLCLHESATTGRIWTPLAAALEGHAQVLAPDRPGWGEAEAPEGYARTTVGEQARLASLALEGLGKPAVVCGSGIGAAAALELMLARPELVTGVVLVEPPLLSFVPEATEQLSADVATVRDEVARGGREAVLGAYLAGRLPALGPGAERIPGEYAEHGARAASSLVAELSAIPAWPRTVAEFAAATRPTLVVMSENSPRYLAQASRELTKVLGRAELRQTDAGLPHVACAGEFAALVAELAASRL